MDKRNPKEYNSRRYDVPNFGFSLHLTGKDIRRLLSRERKRKRFKHVLTTILSLSLVGVLYLYLTAC